VSLLAREGARCHVNEAGPGAEIVTRSAVELVGLMQRGKLSPVEVTDAFLQRAEHVQRELNPFTSLFPEQARAGAAITPGRDSASIAQPPNATAGLRT
jgi:Asp-tRNA(Asn)/Glu-tRNA(Gln) amidotransferase A subunit family amidase